MQVRHVSYAALTDRVRLLLDHVAPLATEGFWFHDLPLGDHPGFELVWPEPPPAGIGPGGPWLEVESRNVPLVPNPTDAYREVLAIDTALAIEELRSGAPLPHLDVFYETFGWESIELLWKWLLARRLQRDDLPELPPGPVCGLPPPGYAERLRGVRGPLEPMHLARLAHVQWLRLFGPGEDPRLEIACAYRLAQTWAAGRSSRSSEDGPTQNGVAKETADG